VVAWGDNTSSQCNVPALPPGLACIEISGCVLSTAARVGVLASYSTFASGCPGSLGTTSLSPSGSLRSGNTLTVTLDRLPQNLAILMEGLSSTTSAFGPLPLALGGFGMPGCFGRVSLDATRVVYGTGNSASFSLTVPNNPALIGVTIFQQALVLDPAAGNPAGAVVSDAARATVGV
jgi:hypothetical protein